MSVNKCKGTFLNHEKSYSIFTDIEWYLQQ